MIDGNPGEETIETLVKTQDEVRSAQMTDKYVTNTDSLMSSPSENSERFPGKGVICCLGLGLF